LIYPALLGQWLGDALAAGAEPRALLPPEALQQLEPPVVLAEALLLLLVEALLLLLPPPPGLATTGLARGKLRQGALVERGQHSWY